MIHFYKPVYRKADTLSWFESGWYTTPSITGVGSVRISGAYNPEFVWVDWPLRAKRDPIEQYIT